jgi:hypothetical protein
MVVAAFSHDIIIFLQNYDGWKKFYYREQRKNLKRNISKNKKIF